MQTLITLNMKTTKTPTYTVVAASLAFFFFCEALVTNIFKNGFCLPLNFCFIFFILRYAPIPLSYYYPFYFCFVVLYALLSILCVLWSVLFFLTYITVLACCVQLQGPLLPAENPTAGRKSYCTKMQSRSICLNGSLLTSPQRTRLVRAVQMPPVLM